MVSRLNPFEFRASFGHSLCGAGRRVITVLIPLNSGLHLDYVAFNYQQVNESLNPFEFRASFGHRGLRSPASPVRLNPFEFRASFGQLAAAQAWPGTDVLIPLNSGLHLDQMRINNNSGIGVLIPLNSGLHLDCCTPWIA